MKPELKNEIAFLEYNKAEKNEHGAYIFISASGKEHISLAYYLLDFKQWLIEQKIVKEC